MTKYQKRKTLFAGLEGQHAECQQRCSYMLWNTVAH